MAARLVAEITADVGGFERGLKRAESSADRFSRDVSNKLGKAFGAGFLAASLLQIPRKLIEQADEISKGAAKLGTTTDEYQMLSIAAKDAGMEVEEFVRSNAKQGIMLDALVSKLEKYRSSIQMTKEEIKDWKELSSGSGSFLKGLLGPLGSALRFGGKLGMSALDVAGAGVSSLLEPFGRTLLPGTDSSDLLYSAGQRFGLVPQDTGSKALNLPAGHGQTAKLKRLTEQLKVLEAKEVDARAQGSTKNSLWNPALTDRQQAGAFVQRSGVVVTEQQKTNEILSDIRKETSEVKDQIRKLKEGT